MSSIYKTLSKNKVLGEFIVTENQVHSFISTNVVTLNLLYSGKVDGGIQRGAINMVSADSSLGKCARGDTKMRIYVHADTADEIKAKLANIRSK